MPQNVWHFIELNNHHHSKIIIPRCSRENKVFKGYCFNIIIADIFSFFFFFCIHLSLRNLMSNYLELLIENKISEYFYSFNKKISVLIKKRLR